MAVENVEGAEPVVEPVVETPAAEPVVESTADPGPGGAGGEGAKTLAEALDAGLESSAKKPEKPAGETPAKVEGAEGETEGETEKKDGDEETPTEDGKKPDEKKELDHVNDPVDPKLSERAQERIRSLVGFVKERDEALKTQGTLIDAISGTGASPEQFANTIDFLRNVNSDDPAMLEAAYKSLQGGMRALAIRMGKSVPEVDLLAEHKDLSDAVKYGQITKEHAQEIATYREQQKVANDQRTRTTAATRATNEAQAEKGAAITALNTLGASLAKSDPDYQRKFDIITGPLKAAFANIRPSQWEATFKAAYADVKLPALPKVVAPAAQVPAKPKNVPIRPVQPAGDGAKKAPATMLDAISSAIEGR